jgi:hypothetical protein
LTLRHAVLPVVAAAVWLSGCAGALKDAPPLADLAGGGPVVSPDQVDGLLRQADAAFARRGTASVRDAASLYLRAAAGDASRTEGLIGAARAQVWLTDHETEPEPREEAARRGVQASQWCIAIAPDRPACQYWLGATVGVQARARPATGLSALPRIEAAFARAAALDPAYERGGPDRALALLYLRAPGWPTGPGDPEKGLDHARKAMALFPLEPPNLLALAEAQAANGDGAGARATAREAAERARALAPDDPDAAEWLREAEQRLQGH